MAKLKLIPDAFPESFTGADADVQEAIEKFHPEIKGI